MKKFCTSVLAAVFLALFVISAQVEAAADRKPVSVTNARWYPLYHIAAPAGWVNDPNGFSYFNGEYHFFYQHYPYDVKWHPMHWGHVVSKDLTHWQHLPIALEPDHIYDASGGCFSGSAIEKDGKLYLMYTGHVDLPVKTLNGADRIETQNIAISEDGLKFTKIAENPVLYVPNIKGVSQSDFRDPKMWEHDGTYYVVVGSRTPTADPEDRRSTGQVLLFESDNLIDWNFKSIMAKGQGNQGFMWECPNFANVDGTDVFIFSPQGVKAEGNKYLNVHQSVYMLGDLDYESGIYKHGNMTMLDYGFDFYAPQVLQMADGRVVMIGWLDMWESKFPEQADGWSCQMTVPRELHVRDGKLYTTPVKELASLRKSEVSYQNLKFRGSKKLEGVSGETGELIATIDTAKSKNFSIEFRSSGKEKTVLSYDAATRTLKLNRDKSGESAGVVGEREVQIEPNDTMKLHVFIDRSSLEIFVNDGEAVISSRIYPQETSQDIVFKAQSGALELKDVTFYTLGEGITQPYFR